MVAKKPQLFVLGSSPEEQAEEEIIIITTTTTCGPRLILGSLTLHVKGLESGAESARADESRTHSGDARFCGQRAKQMLIA